MKKKLLLISTLASLIVIFSFTDKGGDPWIVPEADKKKVNPVKADASSLSYARELWAKHCQSCHGKKGKGDGSKSAQLDTEAGDFSSDVMQSQTDGSLYYKITRGRDDMPGYKKKIPENDDLWSLVNLIRTMKK